MGASYRVHISGGSLFPQVFRTIERAREAAQILRKGLRHDKKVIIRRSGSKNGKGEVVEVFDSILNESTRR